MYRKATLEDTLATITALFDLDGLLSWEDVEALWDEKEAEEAWLRATEATGDTWLERYAPWAA